MAVSSVNICIIIIYVYILKFRIIIIGAYPNTGSFSRTAITARSGARTPMSGVFSALVVLLCLYALTPAFYYIPDAILSAIIIHAVADLVSGPKFLRQLYRVNIFELFTFVAAVLITFFTSVEYGIYVSVILSIAALLLRIARPRYSVLGRIPVQPSTSYYDPNDPHSEKGVVIIDTQQEEDDTKTTKQDENTQYIYVKQDHQTLHHLVESPPAGVVIFRFDESLTYPNASYISDKIMHYIQDNFNSGTPAPTTKGERAWNDRRPLAKKPRPASIANEKDNDAASSAADSDDDDQTTDHNYKQELPKLRAIVLDCSAINHLDSTGVQTLLDLKLTINRFSGYEVEWHFAAVATPAIRSALITGGFGSQAGRGPRTGELLPVVPVYRDGPQCDVNNKDEKLNSGIEANNSSSSNSSNGSTDMTNLSLNEKIDNEMDLSIGKVSSIKTHHEYEQHPASISNYSRTSYVINVDGEGQVEYYPRLDRGLPIDRYPFFHWDLEDAVRAASYTQKRESNSS